MTEKTLLKISQTKANQLSFPQRKFVFGVVNGLLPTQSAKQAYPTQNSNSLKATASRNMAKPKIQTAIQRALVKADLSEDRLVGVISEAIDTETPKTIDWNTKHSYIQTALKLKGYLNKDTANNTQVNIGIGLD